jgi:hypothetical protein
VYFNYESPELLGVSQISQELKGSHLVDNIVLLSYVEISTRLACCSCSRPSSSPAVRAGTSSRPWLRTFTVVLPAAPAGTAAQAS